MQPYYGGQMPLKILDETELWKRQEAEHSIILGELTVGLEQEYVDGLKRWGETLDATHRHVRRFIESVTRVNQQFPPQLYDQVLELVSFCLQESITFKDFCHQILNKSVVTRNNHTVKLFIQHVVNVSDDFIYTAQSTLQDKVTQ